MGLGASRDHLELTMPYLHRGLRNPGPGLGPPVPAACQTPVSGREGGAPGTREEGNPRAGTMDGDRSSVRVCEDDITPQPHAFHLELIGKPR